MIAFMTLLLRGIFLTFFFSGFAAAAQLDLTEKENGKDLWMDRGDLLVLSLIHISEPTRPY